MRIAMVAPPWYPVPPPDYGGIEVVCAQLARGLQDRGHDVKMFATGDSEPGVPLDSALAEHDPDQLRVPEVEAHHLAHAYAQIGDGDYDLIHDNSTVYGPLLLQHQPLPVVHTVHGGLEDEHALDVYQRVCDRIDLIAISCAYRDHAPDLTWAAVIPNPVDVQEYPLVRDKDDYVVWMARFAQVKGADAAIRAARAAGVRIVLAGPVHEPDQAYFDEVIEPLLDQDGVTRIDSVGGSEKAELLGKAIALLSPVDWEEPFGLAPVEAMACGTPVIAFEAGSVPEVMENGVTGFVVRGVDDAVEATRQVRSLSRARCREVFEKRFTASRMANDYMDLYERMMQRDAAYACA